MDEFPESGVAVVEVSSFQLETVANFSPHIAVLLNFSEDHLNRHYTMENYAYLKKRLFANLKESEYAVLNDRCILSDEIESQTKATVYRFSLDRSVNGAHIEGEDVYFGEEKLFSVNRLAMQEPHNLENALASITACKIYGISNQSIERALHTFRGARHRMEFVCKKEGVAYVNDSKATNPDASLSAVRCMKKPTVVLLGGSDKGYSFTSYFAELKNTAVYHAVIYGENRDRIAKDCAIVGFPSYSLVENMQQAFLVAKSMAKEGDTVLLSPASASFDEFNGYDERGDAFIRLVKGEDDEKE